MSEGVTTAVYDTRPRFTLEPEQRSDATLREMLRWLFAIMQQNEPGLRAAIDPEFLHDYRVAVRRTRTLLGQFKGVFPTRTLQRFRNEFAWLGEITGPLRDLDVYLLTLPEYEAELPDDMTDALSPLRAHLRAQRDAAHARLTRRLDSARYRRLCADWERLIAAPPPPSTRLKDARTPVIALSNRQIWKLFRGMLRMGAAIDDHSPPDALHALRKEGKKLRYLLEFFRSLHPKKEVSAAIRALKALQEVLGSYQDLAIQQTELHASVDELGARAPAPAATLLAMRALIDHLARRQQAVRAEFDSQFRRFDARRNRERYRRLFKIGATLTEHPS